MIQINEVVDSRLSDVTGDGVFVGIDIGSRAAKAILLYDGKLYWKMVPSDVSSEKTAWKLLENLAQQAHIAVSQADYIVGTGYGRVAMDFGGIPFSSLTEISCHALGAHYLNADTRTIIDIGGQDSKAIRIDPESGKVNEFVMNDKCAAGTGRFLEKVALLLEIPLDQLGECALNATESIEISSQCVVFAESEVVSLRAQGQSKENIAAGIHNATARRIRGLLNRVGFEDVVLFTGGVSNNPGMRRSLENVIGTHLGTTKFNTAFAGALGAAINAERFAKKADNISI